MMRHFESINPMIRYREGLGPDLKLGFVPTMGALHEGHLELVKRAKTENNRVAVSIFVNPIQFNNPDDLKRYPRDLQKDKDLLNSVLDENDFIFSPTEAEMYPDTPTKKYDFGSLEQVMEGAHRPGHFNGVGIVVDRLFRLVNPHRAYFGLKDFQQLAIIQHLVKIEQYPLEIIPCEIVRETDGLAMSSRNARLSPENRKNAPRIYEGISKLRSLALQGGNLPDLAKNLRLELNQLPEFEVEYISFAQEHDLSETESLTNSRVRCFIAVWVGQVRLIDNLPLY